MSQPLRRWLGPLRVTPLHPQWLVLLGEQETRGVLARFARGLVLDIGCGDRWAEAALPPNATYLGLHYPNTVELGYRGRPDLFADAHQLPLAEESIDTALIMDVLEHLLEPDVALEEIRRTLKPAGVIIVQVPFLYPLHDEPYDFQRWTIHGLKLLLRRHKVSIIEETSQGQPLDCAAALAAIAIAKGVVDAASRPTFAILLAPLLLISIPLVNLTGWLFARLLPRSSLMPIGYRVIARKDE